MAQQNWNTPQNFKDLVARTEKRLAVLERRPVPTSAADLLGPTAGKTAVLISDWNADVASLNGYVWSAVGALHSPDPTLTWTGQVIAHDDHSGIQQAWNADDLDNVLFSMRTFTTDGSTNGRTYSAWRAFATPSGFVEYTNLSGDVRTMLDDGEAALGLVLPPLRVYRQDDPPTNPDDVGRALQVGDQWLDTNDDNHPYIWDGTDWVDYAAYVLGDTEAQIATAQAAAEAAANAAADALDFAAAIITDLTELVRNGNFQNGVIAATPDDWEDASGGGSLKLEANVNASGGQWAIMHTPTAITYSQGFSTAFPVTPGASYVASAQMAYTGAVPSASFWVSWYDYEPSLTDGTDGNKGVSSILTNNPLTGRSGYPKDFAPITGQVVAPAGAIWARIEIWNWHPVGDSTVRLDDISMQKVITGTQLAADSINGKTITGALFQTVVTASRGIKINSSGFAAYADGSGALSAGTASFVVDAATGAVTIVGPVMTGGTITGPVFQTTATAARGIKITTSGLVAYNSSGTPTIVIDASTGNVTITGALTAGSTIDGATVTGGTIQTSATASRGIKMNSSGLVAYDGSGVVQFLIDATTGSMTGAGTITGPTFQTAGSGKRWVISAASRDTIFGYTGDVSETTPGSLQIGINPVTLRETTSLFGPVISGGGQASVQLNSFGGVCNMVLIADTIGLSSPSVTLTGHLVVAGTGWTTLPMNSNYVSFGSGYQAPEYKRVGNTVQLRGMLTRNTLNAPAGSTAATMPSGTRPLAARLFQQHLSGNPCRVDILTSGAIQHVDQPLNVGGYLTLDGIEYQID